VLVPDEYCCIACLVSDCEECASRGLSTAELDASIVTLRRISEKLNADCVELRRRQEHHGCIADLLIRQRADERDFIEVRSVSKLMLQFMIAHHISKDQPNSWFLGRDIFCEIGRHPWKCPFPWNSAKSVILVLLLAFLKVFRVLPFNSFCADFAVC